MRITVTGSLADRGRLAHHVGEQSQFADQRAGTDGDFIAVGESAGIETDRTFLHDIAAVGEFAGIKQNRTALQLLGFGADRQNAQGLSVERREDRHLLEKGNVVVEAHIIPFIPARSRSKNGVLSERL